MNFTVRRASWAQEQDPITSLRHRVFVQGQGVSEEEELDGLDALDTTLHFLGFCDQRPIATGRILQSGKIGRICVLEDYRGRGYGKRLLMTMVRHALEEAGLTRLYLHAQLNALPLYEKCGFVAEGEVFMEAGIKHRRMTQNLEDSASLEQIYGDEVLRCARAHDFSRHLRQMIKAGRRTLDVLTLCLSHAVYTAEVTKAISFLARSHRQARIRILVQDTRPLAASNHPVVTLAQRLPSTIHIRALSEKPQQPDAGFASVDQRHLLFFNDENALDGFVNYRARAESAHQLEEFDNLWQRHSREDPNLARLTL